MKNTTYISLSLCCVNTQSTQPPHFTNKWSPTPGKGHVLGERPLFQIIFVVGVGSKLVREGGYLKGHLFDDLSVVQMTNTYFAKFSHETLHTAAAKSVIFVVRDTRTTVLAGRRQTWGLK